ELLNSKEFVIKNVSKNVKGKKIYVPENITYSLPATEKQFTGFFPSGTCVKIPKDMIVGVHWKNVKDNLARLLKTNGIAICCGWSSQGLGKNRGFKIEEILLVPHGGSKNDTIVTVERKLWKK
ncbi:hypothetical protein LCGC14_2059240, partial [marine sediment metagenome]